MIREETTVVHINPKLIEDLNKAIAKGMSFVNEKYKAKEAPVKKIIKKIDRAIFGASLTKVRKQKGIKPKKSVGFDRAMYSMHVPPQDK
jgi:hypothetical protein